MNVAIVRGDEAELQRVHEAWASVVGGGGPRVVALIGASGDDDTRLAQAFYRSLAAKARTEAGEGYWPPELGAVDGAHLQVNPPISSVDARHVMPFMWWGIRVANRDARHADASSAIATYARALEQHTEAIVWASRARRNAPHERRSLQAEATRSFGTAAAAKRLHLDDVFGFFQLLLNDDAERAATPMVWLIDDGQYTPHDTGVIDLLQKVLAAATHGGWPLLILVTHGAKEWRDTPAARSIRSALQMERRIPWTAIELRGSARAPEAKAAFEAERAKRVAHHEEAPTEQSERALGGSHLNLTESALVRGDLAAAMRHATEALAIAERYPEAQRDVSYALGRIAQIHEAYDDFDTALDYQERALAIDEELLVRLGTPEARRDVGITLMRIAEIQIRRYDPHEALACTLRELDVLAPLVEGGGDIDVTIQFAEALARSGFLQRQLGDLHAARESYVEAIACIRAIRATPGAPGVLYLLRHALAASASIAEGLGLHEEANAYREEWRSWG